MPFESLHRQAQQVLEWPALLEHLAAQAHSEMGRERCHSLIPESTRELAQERVKETTEMVGILNSDFPLPALRFPDIRPLLLRAGKGSVLEGHECHAVSSLLETAELAQACAANHQQEAPRLWKRMSRLSLPLHLKRSIDRCLDREGNMLETASPTLHGLLQETKGLKHRIRQRLENILSSQQYEDVLQEQYFVQRENRYVLPVKTDMQSKLPGIVHDVSGSGATVFIEPRELVDLNNRIKFTELHISREVRRILTDLTSAIGACQIELAQLLELLADLDCLAAKARLSRMMQGVEVSLNDYGRILLIGARHPLLLMAKESVVPNDLVLDEHTHVCVISGPNTGGKTVMLKLLGLYALMVRTGLHLPCQDGSEMGVFSEIYADIGDAQDLTRDLSSFSAHLMTLVKILEIAGTRVGTTHGSTLVLLDEIGGSTDPVEGAALAEVVLRRFVELGLKTVVTTHYHGLKVLAHESADFINASLEFDRQTLAPTYRVIQGFPGGSSALEIAARLGMDPRLLEKAGSLIQPATRHINQMIQELQEARSQLESERIQLQTQRKEAERLAEEAKVKMDRLQTTERQEIRKMRKRLQESFAQARVEIQGLLREVKQERSAQKLGQAKQALQEMGKTVFPPNHTEAPGIPLEHLKVGDLVTIVSTGTAGRLLEAPQGKKRLRIQVGQTEVSVDINKVVGGGASNEEGPGKRERSRSAQPCDFHSVGMTQSGPHVQLTSYSTVDLRGYMVEEALEALIKAVDQSALLNIQGLRIIHGHGTGKLKAAVRNFCAQAPEITDFRPGEGGEGGDGVTIVLLDYS